MGGVNPMFKIATAIAAVSLAAAGFAAPANAQVLVHKDLSLAMATTIALTAVENCKTAGYNVSVHVMGRNGEVLVALRHHAAGPNTFENSMKKAYTARTFRIPSGKFAENVGQNPVAGALMLANVVAARGALPIMIGEETIGGVGVSGAPGGDKDEVCAQAGIDKVKDQLK
jgi:uncharacterized protein GlcG (DUF336 family)